MGDRPTPASCRQLFVPPHEGLRMLMARAHGVGEVRMAKLSVLLGQAKIPHNVQQFRQGADLLAGWDRHNRGSG